MPRSGFGTTTWEGNKVIVDATRPTHFAFGSRSTIPDEVLARMQLTDYVPSEARPVVIFRHIACSPPDVIPRPRPPGLFEGIRTW